MRKHIFKYIPIAALALAASAMLTACTETDQSNKTERLAIKKGNKNYDKSKFDEARKYYMEALDANPNSDVAQYDLAMAKLNGANNDTTMLKEAREMLLNLGENSQNVAVSEKSLYNLGNDAVYCGDAMKMISEDKSGKVDPQMAQQAGQQSTQFYKQAIEIYKKLLRKNPKNIRALQNLRIAQLKLPPEEQGGGGGNDQQQQQQQPQQQDQQQQQQEQQQPEPQKQNQDDQQILQSMQAKENKTRRDNEKREVQGRATTDKPW